MTAEIAASSWLSAPAFTAAGSNCTSWSGATPSFSTCHSPAVDDDGVGVALCEEHPVEEQVAAVGRVRQVDVGNSAATLALDVLLVVRDPVPLSQAGLALDRDDCDGALRRLITVTADSERD